MFKYADDATLLVPEHTDIDVELSHVKAWALTNQLRLDLTKTKEIVSKRRRVNHQSELVGDVAVPVSVCQAVLF